MNTMGSLASAIRQHPWSSTVDATLLSLAMLTSLLLALEYDIVAFWDDFSERQRRLRVEEIFLLTALLAAGFGFFTIRRMRKARLDHERKLRIELEAMTNRALAMQDPLTELPNRRQLRAALAEAIASAPTGNGVHAYYLLDLNGFKRVNDEHGHAAGDELLRIVARRFRAAARREDMVARIGGDEFAVLASDVESRAKAAEIGERFVSALGPEIASAGRQYRIGVSVGVALYPEDGGTIDEIMHRADLAMYQAKARPQSNLCFYEAS